MHAQFVTEGTFTPDALLSGSASHLVQVKVTILAGQVLKRGAVLGRITASSKYVLSLGAANDGSQAPDAVLAMDVDATGGDVEVVVIIRGDLNKQAVILGAGHTVGSVFEALRDKGIFLI